LDALILLSIDTYGSFLKESPTLEEKTTLFMEKQKHIFMV
jgi:hypothetical protein